jgi:hypothetical protein
MDRVKSLPAFIWCAFSPVCPVSQSPGLVLAHALSDRASTRELSPSDNLAIHDTSCATPEMKGSTNAYIPRAFPSLNAPPRLPGSARITGLTTMRAKKICPQSALAPKTSSSSSSQPLDKYDGDCSEGIRPPHPTQCTKKTRHLALAAVASDTPQRISSFERQKLTGILPWGKQELFIGVDSFQDLARGICFGEWSASSQSTVPAAAWAGASCLSRALIPTSSSCRQSSMLPRLCRAR